VTAATVVVGPAGSAVLAGPSSPGALVVAVVAAATAVVLLLPRRGVGGRRLGGLAEGSRLGTRPPAGRTVRGAGADSAPAVEDRSGLDSWVEHDGHGGRSAGRPEPPAGRGSPCGERSADRVDGDPATAVDEAAQRWADHRRRVRSRRIALAGMAVALVAALGVLPGLVVGLTGGIVADRLLDRLEPASERRRTAQLVEDLPAFADLLATTTQAGVPIARAVAVCAHALGGPLGVAGNRVATALRLGAEPGEAWALLAVDEPMRPLAAAMTRAGHRGLAPTAALKACAAEARQERAHAAAKRSRSVGVAAAAPLGFCFLPAFVLLAVVPTVLGMLGPLFGG